MHENRDSSHRATRLSDLRPANQIIHIATSHSLPPLPPPYAVQRWNCRTCKFNVPTQSPHPRPRDAPVPVQGSLLLPGESDFLQPRKPRAIAVWQGPVVQDTQERRQATAQPRLKTVIHNLSSTFMAQKQVLHQEFPT